MVTTNFQTFGSKGFSLRFRMYRDGETRYISVNSLLQGKILMRHWNQKKQMLIPSAPFSEENNEALAKFKAKYDAALMDWEGSLFSFALNARESGVEKVSHRERTLKETMEWVVAEAQKSRHADGTQCGTYESYIKTIKRLEEFCSMRHVRYDTLLLKDLDKVFIESTLDWIMEVKKGRGKYFSTMFRAALMKAAAQGWIDKAFVESCAWLKYGKSHARKYETLTAAQCQKLVNMELSEFPASKKVQLYRDFAVFILYTCQSACDALSMKYSDIKTIDGVEYFVFKRRKIESKQVTDCLVPINATVREIMDRWKRISKDGYVLPVRSKDKIARNNNSNADIKCFLKKFNVWLKPLGKILGCEFGLHSYVFRHTGITHYISKDIPIIYVANLAGTSVDNCEKIYYNNRGDKVSRDKVLNALSF